jgi:hypothetical protein
MLTASWRDGRNLGTSPRLQGQAGFMDCLQGTRLRAGAGAQPPLPARPRTRCDVTTADETPKLDAQFWLVR